MINGELYLSLKMEVQKMLESKITTDEKLPNIHPGEILKEDFLDLYIVHFSTFDYSVNERAAVIKQGNLIVNKELDLTIHLSRTKNYLPITYKYKSKEGKIIAKQPTLWENIFEGEKTEYHWDNNQRISKIVITEGKEKTVYTYEYEMY